MRQAQLVVEHIAMYDRRQRLDCLVLKRRSLERNLELNLPRQSGKGDEEA